MSYIDTFDLVPLYGYMGRMKGIVSGIKWKLDYLKNSGKKISRGDLENEINRIGKTVRNMERFLTEVQDKKGMMVGVNGGLVSTRGDK